MKQKKLIILLIFFSFFSLKTSDEQIQEDLASKNAENQNERIQEDLASKNAENQETRCIDCIPIAEIEEPQYQKDIENALVEKRSSDSQLRKNTEHTKGVQTEAPGNKKPAASQTPSYSSNYQDSSDDDFFGSLFD